ncbi:flagellar protein FliT [Aliamphritea hakodatensis]|uniref:flagellar protein FliT n=1 Tax=Aliamphritea hakodatensis TaxID=2895352 RepID=UPI0022FD5B55|nr:flagellar protein FliT [Aliamphritea hakodatensis]
MIRTLRHILQLSEQVLQAAEEKDWPAVEALQQEREQLSKQAVASDIPQDKDTSLEAEELIRKVHQLDAKSLTLIEGNKQEVIQEKLRSNKRNKMAKAYINQPKF